MKKFVRKNELVAEVFVASETGIKPIKSVVEIEADLKTLISQTEKWRSEYTWPDPFKIPHGWMNEDEGMKFWSMLLDPDIFN